MGLTMKEKKAVIKEIAKRYQKARKKEKGRILDEFTKLTNYARCYASYVLGNRDTKTTLNMKKKRKRVYGYKVFTALKSIWIICGRICGKRLAPYLKEIVPKLERHRELIVDRETKEKILGISASTIDRLLSNERAKMRLKSRSRTKPGTLLKNQIPIRTFTDWDENRPGFVEIDLVSHDGGNTRGDYAQTLDVTDVYTGWTETQAVKNKAQIWTFEALKDIRERLPFKLLGIDSDNGSEFINAHLLRFCKQEEITFTRTRPYRKNDNCFIEQKNYSVVRKNVGYYRYETKKELEMLNELYKVLRLYTNFFQPVMKLVKKTRVGSKVIKRYDEAKTPYQRVPDSPYVPEEDKEKLRAEYDQLNPAELKRELTKLKSRLMREASAKHFGIEFK
jgi:hypothetical protein